MVYLLAFIEGIITFVSPCILPLLPVYLAYFLGAKGKNSNWRLFINSSSFVLGFTTVFVSMGVLVSFLGGVLIRYQSQIQFFSGLFVVVSGLYLLQVIPQSWFQLKGKKQRFNANNFQKYPWSYFLFGLIFALAWSPCLGAFLGSALSLASQSTTMVAGGLMLLLYSLGLGIPFILSAFLLESIKGVVTTLKGQGQLISRLSGSLLIVLGLLMMTGWLNRLQLLLL